MATKAKSKTSRNSKKKGTASRSSASGSRRNRPSTKNQKKPSTAKGSARTRRADIPEKESINMGIEIQLVLSLCITVILMLSNFGLCGEVGRWMSSFLFGLFGCVQYVMPVVFFIGIALLLVNDYSSLALKKCFAGFIFFMMISAFAQLIYKDANIEFFELFSRALEDRTTGGVIGGGFAILLKRWFGLAGACVIVASIFLLSCIMLVQKSAVEFFRNLIFGMQEHMASSREARAQRAILRAEEREEGEENLPKAGRRRKTARDVLREKQCEEKVKELEHKKQESRKKVDSDSVTEDKLSTKDHAVPTFHSSSEVKRKDAVKELHPEMYPFTEDDGKTTPFEKELDFTAFSFGTDKTSEEFQKELREHAMSKEELESRLKDAQIIRGRNIQEIAMVEEEFQDEDYTDSKEEELPDVNGMDLYEDDIPVTEDRKEEEIVEVEAMEITEQEEEPAKEEVAEEITALKPASRDIVIHKEEKKEHEKVRTIHPANVKKAEGKDYLFPPISLLSVGEARKNVNYDDALRSTAQKLQETLSSFGVNVKITDISFGPTVTRYEMVPEQGTKVSKIVSLTDDIKLNLAAADIRIEAPIPGKSAIGIEVPNKDVLTVHFRELLESSKYRNARSKLSFAVGKDIGGQTIITDIAKMPHLLVAGQTGSGKSVCINTLIMSILYKARPDEVKLILIDPKMVELSIYNGIPHLLIPVVTDPKKASGALNWAVAEMTERYNKFTTYGVRNMQGYNDKVKQVIASGEVDADKLKPMPQIVIIIDELADLMMVASSEVEDAIVRLSQLARAAGIHLVIATQRPSVNVITGLIKANVPSRIAFAVASGVDSRTILDMNGAEKLLGKGDMLFYPAGSSKPSRVQGAFISDEEISSVVEFLKENGEMAIYDDDIKDKIEKKIVNQDSSQERDEYFEDAARFLLEKEKASIGMLQRMFKIGFNRAARIMDQLAEAGIVGPEEGTKPRKILMSPEQLEQYFEEYL